MLTYVHKLSGFLFYLLGGSFFLSFMLQYNQIGSFGGWWLKVADLPLALVGVIFGGSSLYLSVKPKNKDSKVLFILIGLPLMVLFVSLIVMNFWSLFTV